MSAIPQASQANPQVQKSLLPPTYEFTKRKRWADLLHTEPADTITFVLSFSSTVLHCSLTIKELLGWKDVDLIDCDLIDLIAPDDQVAFRASFEESIRNKSELQSFVRLQCNGNRSSYSDTHSEDVLFEIKGNPHFARECETEGNFFLAVAKAYPSRNTALFDTYALLKEDNERLQQRVLELQNCASGQSLVSHTDPKTLKPMTSQWNAETSSPFYPSSFTPRPTGFDGAPPSTASISFDGGINDDAPPHGTLSTALQNADEDNEEVSRKKKAKRTYIGEQYVCITCGRTDSPEWRKGPLGPKTLCNACGLRWAKQMRRIDDPAEGVGEAA